MRGCGRVVGLESSREACFGSRGGEEREGERGAEGQGTEDGQQGDRERGSRTRHPQLSPVTSRGMKQREQKSRRALHNRFPS